MFVQHLHRSGRWNGAKRIDGVVKRGIIGVVSGTAVFVADFDILQIERRRMTIGGALRSPSTIGVAIGILNRIQSFLHPRTEIICRDNLAPGDAAVDTQQRRGADVLAHLQILVVTQAVIHHVTPNIIARGAIGRVADGEFPVISVGKVDAIHPTAAGKAHERRLQVHQHVRQIRS